MILRSLGPEALSRLMRVDDADGPDLSWLLFGPVDPAVVEADQDDALPLAAD